MRRYFSTSLGPKTIKLKVSSAAANKTPIPIKPTINKNNEDFGDIQHLISEKLLGFETWAEKSPSTPHSGSDPQSINNGSVEVPEEDIPLNPRVAAVAKTLGLDDDGLLPLHFSNGVHHTPFEMFNSSYKSGGQSKISHKITPRLSVTKLLTKQWCELREFYDIYSGGEAEETKAMRDGKIVHSKLEMDSHPPENISGVVKALAGINLKTLEYQQAENLITNMRRLVDLLTMGEAREISVFGYVNRDLQRLSNMDSEAGFSDNDILISGIIDHLVLTSGDSQKLDTTLSEFKNSLEFARGDLGHFLRTARPIVSDSIGKLTIGVSDVKTRQKRGLPPQKSVLEGARLQVSFYRELLGSLGGSHYVEPYHSYDSGEFGYSMILENLRRKKVDVDAPIDPIYAMVFLKLFPSLFDDFKRLADGTSIFFEPYDNWIIECGDNLPPYDASYLQEADILKEDPEFNIPQIQKLFKVWKTPLTFRYLASRMAELFNLISPLLGDVVSVQYYHNGVAFRTKSYEFDENELSAATQSSMDFWLGKRDPQGVRKDFEGLLKCKYCAFESRCGHLHARSNNYR